MSKKEKNQNSLTPQTLLTPAGLAGSGLGAAIYGLGKVRQVHQDKVNVNKVTLRGGSGTTGNNVFDTQRSS